MLLSHADILVQDESGFHTLRNAYLHTRGAMIAYIGAERPAAFDGPEKDMAGKLLIPALYNTHTHTPMTLLRGVGAGLPLDRWLHEAMFPVEARMSAQDVRAGARLAMLELLASGAVGFTDMYFHAGVIAEEAAQAGMKANICVAVLSPDPDEPYEHNALVRQLHAFRRDWNNAAGGRIVAEFGIHAEYTNSERVVRLLAQECLEVGGRMHLHLSETKAEHEGCKARRGMTPAAWFTKLGAFDSPALAAHCVWAEPEDWRILREKGVAVAHNPSSNMKLGSGFLPLRQLLDAGVCVSLGTDGAASNNNLNMFEEMHLAGIIHNGHVLDPTAIGACDVLRMATRNGALAQGRPDCGLLVEGFRADIVAVDLDAPHLTPALDIPSLLVYSAQAGDVYMTMADGEILYENGEYKTIDREKTMFDARQAAKRLFG